MRPRPAVSSAAVPGLNRPDVQYTFMVGMKDNPRTLPRKHGYFLHMAVLRPRTRGTVELAAPTPPPSR